MISTNKAAVRRALEDWFIAARAGETLGARETAALSASDAAAQSSDYFYERLIHHSADEVELAQAKGTLSVAVGEVTAAQVAPVGTASEPASDDFF